MQGLVIRGSSQLLEYVVSGGQPPPSSENANRFLSQCQHTQARHSSFHGLINVSPVCSLTGPLVFSQVAQKLETLFF